MKQPGRTERPPKLLGSLGCRLLAHGNQNVFTGSTPCIVRALAPSWVLHWLPRRLRARPSVALDEPPNRRRRIRVLSTDFHSPSSFPLNSHPALCERRSVKNPWLERRVLTYAHQGGAKEAPSSTLAAFSRAVAIGCPALEMDVHLTLDGELVVSHDETVDRTTSSSGRISELTWEQLGELDNAYWFVPGADVEQGRTADSYSCRGLYPGNSAYGFARLEDVLKEFPDIFLNLDIKETSPTVVGYERQLAEVLRAYGRFDDVIVASFHDEALQRFRHLAPEIHTSLGTNEVLAFGMAFAQRGPLPKRLESTVAMQVPEMYGDHRIVTASFVESAHEAGLAIHVWTVDDETDLHRLLDVGVDGIITDVPSLALQVVERRQYLFRK